MVKVSFLYDEPSRKWDVEVEAESEVEAKQAFNAVCLTCREPMIGMGHQVTSIPNRANTWSLIPAVIR